jgi:hypothetical protein
MDICDVKMELGVGKYDDWEDDCIVKVYWLEVVKLIKSYHTFWLVLFHPFSICHMSSSYMGGGSCIKAESKPLVHFLLRRLLRSLRDRE